MKWEVLMRDVVDVQPAFDLLAAMDHELTGPEERTFALHKLERCVVRLRETADYLEKKLKSRTPTKR
jgi:hypothetical protein